MVVQWPSMCIYTSFAKFWGLKFDRCVHKCSIVRSLSMITLIHIWQHRLLQFLLYAFISFTFQGWIWYRSFCFGRAPGARGKTVKYSKFQIILGSASKNYQIFEISNQVCNLTLHLTLPYFLPYLTIRLTLLYRMSYLTSPHLTLPYLTLPYLTIPYLMS